MALGTLVGAGFVRISADTKPAEKAMKSLGAIGSQVLVSALSAASGPVAAAVSVAVGGLVAGFAAAGAAAGAFGAAVIPQFKAITEAGTKYTASQDAQTKADIATANAKDIAKAAGVKYGDAIKITSKMSDSARDKAEQYNSALSASKSATDAAKQSQQLYKADLAAMTPATRQTANAFQGLKDDFKNWSDSLSGTTMPIFTRGIEMLRGLLPKLTPFVKIASIQIKDFVDNLGAGGGKVFGEFGNGLQRIAGGSLKNFLAVIKNIGVGFVGILNAFLPMSVGVTGGLAGLTKKFADFGAGLKDSQGFQDWIANMKQAGPGLMKTFKQIADAVMTMVQALAPVSGIGLKTAQVFAQIVAAIPTPVLAALTQAIVAVNVVMKLWAIGSAAAAAATWLFSTSITTNTGYVYSNRIVMVLHRASLVASAVASRVAAAATWVFSLATRAATLAMTAMRYAMALLQLVTVITTTAFRALALAMLTSPIGLIIIAVIALAAVFVVLWKKFDWFRNFWKAAWKGIQIAAKAVWDWLKANWPFLLSILLGPIAAAAYQIYKHWDAIKQGAVKAFVTVVGFVTGLPARIATAVGGLGRTLYNKGRDLLLGLLNGAISINTRISGWLVALPGRIGKWIGSLARTIYSKGRDLITGLLSGAMALDVRLGGWLRALPGRIGRWIGSLARTVYNKGRDLITGLLNGAISINTRISTWLRAMPGRLAKWIGGLGRTLYSRGSDLIQGLLNGATSKAAKVGSWAGKIKDKIVSAIKGVFGIHSPSTVMAGLGVHMMTGFLNGMLSQDGFVTGMMRSLFGSKADMLKKIMGGGIKGIGKDILGFLGLGGGGGGGAGVQKWRGLVQMVLAQLGQSQGWTDTVLRRMNQESGGNPRAINLWDSNAKAGHPSQGLMQTIPGTFAAYAGPYRGRGIMDPLANIYAGINYAIHRYGTLAALNRPGGYANGTTGSTKGWHWVGERGPELLNLPTGAKVMSNQRSVAAAGGGGMALSVTINMKSSVVGKGEFRDAVIEALDQARRRGWKAP